MCGRVKLEGDFSELRVQFRISPDYSAPNYAPNWNVAPTDKLPIVYNPKTKAQALDLMRWGLVPYWAKDVRVGVSTINAMAETLDTKPMMFREAFKRRRCLVPVEAYYERKKLDDKIISERSRPLGDWRRRQHHPGCGPGVSRRWRARPETGKGTPARDARVDRLCIRSADDPTPGRPRRALWLGCRR
jgi:putative SOS response-associated peptidase YedK